jgi:dihydroorotase-like cyclic amidohydrolase
MKILIKNASYVVRDVNRIEKNVDILINGNKISKVGKCCHSWTNEGNITKVINASGKAVIPY